VIAQRLYRVRNKPTLKREPISIVVMEGRHCLVAQPCVVAPGLFVSLAMLSHNDMLALAATLGEPTVADRAWHWSIRDAASTRVLALTVSTEVDLGDGAMGTVVSAQTHQGYLELHDVTAVLTIEPDEVMFISKRGDTFSSLVVGTSCTCSLFSNIRMSLVSADFAALHPAVLMAAMQLSLAESLLEQRS